MRILITLLLCIGFFFTIHNNTDKPLDCMLYWVNHPFKFNGAVNIYGGEHESGEKFEPFMEYYSGQYYVKWTVPRNKELKSVYGFIVTDNIKRVLITPEGATME